MCTAALTALLTRRMGWKEAALKQSLGFIQMVSKMHRETYTKGEIVFRQGMPHRCVHAAAMPRAFRPLLHP